MSTFYVDTSQPFNGDGTAPTPATSDGSAGASNDVANALKGTPAHGAIVAGDIVWLRAFGTDPSVAGDVSISESLTMLDGLTVKADSQGEVWAGSAGSFVIERPNYNAFKFGSGLTAGVSLRYVSFATYEGLWTLRTANNAQVVDNVIWTIERHTSNAHFEINLGDRSRFRNAYFDLGRGSSYRSLFTINRARTSVLEGCTLDFRRNAVSNGVYLAPRGDSYGPSALDLQNCRVLGADKLTTLLSQSNSSDASDFPTNWRNVQFDYDPSIALAPHAEYQSTFDVSGTDGQFGFIHETNQCRTTWRKNENYPTLNALLPDGKTPWSIRVLPFSIVDSEHPATFNPLLKNYRADVAARQRVRVELVIKESYANPQDDEWWIEVAYYDDQGQLRTESTRGSGAPLDSSAALWNPMAGSRVVYGPNNYDRYKVESETSHPIAPESLVSVALKSSRPSVVEGDYYFVCPDFVLEAI